MKNKVSKIKDKEIEEQSGKENEEGVDGNGGIFAVEEFSHASRSSSRSVSSGIAVRSASAKGA